MRTSWINQLMAVVMTRLAFAEQPSDSCWSLDKEVLQVGGCVTLALDGPCKEFRRKTLQINEREPIRIAGFGPMYSGRHSPFPGREATLVLIFIDLVSPDHVEPIPGEPGAYRMRPLFSEPGEYALTLLDGDVSLGTKTVTVLPSVPESEDALRLLRPRVGKKLPNQDGFLWFQLITAGLSTWAANPLSEREMQVLRDQLPILQKHPDWAEIAEVRLAGLEAMHYVRENSEEDEKGGYRLRADVENPSLPGLVTQCLRRKPTSRFAEAAQDDVTVAVSEFNVRLKRRNRVKDGDR